jgi:hypothetical protein
MIDKSWQGENSVNAKVILHSVWNNISEPRTQRSEVSGTFSTPTPLSPLRYVRGFDKCVKPDRARYI